MSKFDLKVSALMLRKKGFSIKEIAKEISISRSTASVWCRDISLTESQINSLKKRAQIGNYKGALKGALTNRLKSEAVISEEKKKARQFIKGLTDREICLIGTSLYWAEGHKTGKTFGIVNSDSKIILVVMKWLKIQFDLQPKDYLPRLFINESHRDREVEIIKYWSGVTKIPLSQFRNTIFIKSVHKKVFSDRSSYTGVMHLRVSKSSKVLYRTLEQVQILRNIPVEI